METCINWHWGNCTWDRCYRTHVYSNCHPLFSCQTRVSSSKSKFIWLRMITCPKSRHRSQCVNFRCRTHTELSSSLYVRCITSDIPECQRRIQNSYLDDRSPPSSLYVRCITSDIPECQRRIQNSYLHHVQVACMSGVSRLTSQNVNVEYRTHTYIISK